MFTPLCNCRCILARISMEQEDITFLSRWWLRSQHYKVALVTWTLTKGIISQKVYRLIIRFPKKLWMFHGMWSDTKFNGIPWNIPWNSMQLWCRQTKYHRVPWNSMELWGLKIKDHQVQSSSIELLDCFFNWHHVFMEFYRTLHGISWDFEGAIPNDTMVSLNSMEYSIKFHGTLEPRVQMWPSSMEFHWRLAFFLNYICVLYDVDHPIISMETTCHQEQNQQSHGTWSYLGGRHSKWQKGSREFHWIFQGIPWNFENFN